MSDVERLLAPLPDPFAAHSQGQFAEPWLRRVRDVDDDTLAGLLKTLVGLRRLRLGATAFAAVAGALVFGLLDTPYAILIHATLGRVFGHHAPLHEGGAPRRALSERGRPRPHPRAATGPPAGALEG